MRAGALSALRHAQAHAVGLVRRVQRLRAVRSRDASGLLLHRRPAQDRRPRRRRFPRCGGGDGARSRAPAVDALVRGRQARLRDRRSRLHARGRERAAQVLRRATRQRRDGRHDERGGAHSADDRLAARRGDVSAAQRRRGRARLGAVRCRARRRAARGDGRQRQRDARARVLERRRRRDA